MITKSFQYYSVLFVYLSNVKCIFTNLWAMYYVALVNKQLNFELEFLKIKPNYKID